MGDVMPLLERLLALHGDSGRLHYLAGHFFRNAGDSAKALVNFGLSTRLTPGYAPAHRELGTELEKGGRFEDALLSFERALALEPREHVHYANVIRLSERLGKLNDLAARWMARFQSGRENPALREGLVEVLHKSGRLEEASRILGESSQPGSQDRPSE